MMSVKQLLGFCFIFFALAIHTNAQTAVQPQGDGTEADPYLISNWQELLWVSQTNNELDKYFLQTADIDFADADPAIETWNSGKGWGTIGRGNGGLKGVYDGGGHLVKNLYCNYSPTSYIGLFYEVEIGGIVKNLGVTNADLTVAYYSGILVGYNKGTIEQCFSTGQINTSHSAGGLIGYNSGTVTDCFSLADIISAADNSIGGLVGYNYSGEVSRCYAAGAVKTGSSVAKQGGLVGKLYAGTFSNNYWDTESSLVTGTGGLDAGAVKGLTNLQMQNQANFSGWDFGNVWHQNASINQGYPYLTPINNSTTKISILTKSLASNSLLANGFLRLGTQAVQEYGIVGGLAEDATISSNTFALSESNPSASESISFLIEDLAMGTEYFYRSYITTSSGTEYGPNISFTTDTVQTVIPQGDGTEQSPYEISTWQELLWLDRTPTTWDSYFLQTADIDYAEALAAEADYAWVPIGTYYTPFSGNYNGGQHTIDRLFVERQTFSAGFFGTIGETAVISYLGISNAQVSGGTYAGLLAAHNSGTIKNCFTTGTITGDSFTGAFVGYHETGSITDCYSLANAVTTGSISSSVSNFIAFISGGTVENCYATGSVSTSESDFITDKVFYSDYYSSSVVSFSSNYWNSTTSYVQNVESLADGAVLPLTQDEMQQQASFEGWDFSGTWLIDPAENYGYPYLFAYASDRSFTNVIISQVSGVSFSFQSILSKGSDAVLEFGFVGGTVSGLEVGSTDVLFSYNQTSTDESASFTDMVTGLFPETEYIIRPYVTTTSGTNYGNELSFTTGTLLANVPEGVGTEANPFIIDTWDDLYWLSNTASVWDKYFLQTADIDFADADSALSTWNGGEGFLPIGNGTDGFAGDYNGGNHIIRGLYVNRPSSYSQALFANNSGTIQKLGLLDVFVVGNKYVGSVVGYNSGIVSECYSTGVVYGTDEVGGFVGYNSDYISSSGITGDISNCFTLCDVYSDSYYYNAYLFVGNSRGSVSNCYAAGKALSSSGDSYSRPFASSSSHSSCYFDADNSNYTYLHDNALSNQQMCDQASFVDWNFDTIWSIDPSINYGYPYLQTMDGMPSSVRLTKGNTGGTSFVMDSYLRLGDEVIAEYGFVYGTSIDIDLDNAEKMSTVNPAASGLMQFRVTGLAVDTKYYIKSFNNTDGTVAYGKLDSITTDAEATLVPFGNGTEADPFLISNSEELHWVADKKYIRDKHYLQTADIDLNDADPSLETWYRGSGWRPIAHDYDKFDGVYDGGGHSIINLKITTAFRNAAALFSYIDTDGIVRNLGLLDVNVNSSASYSAALVGQNLGTVEYCFSTGTVTSAGTSGGLIGYNEYGSVKNCFSRCKVIRTDDYDSYTGAFVGHSFSGSILNCYSTGSVTVNNGSEYSDHAFLGYNSYGTIASNYWNTDLSLSVNPGVSGSASPLTNTEMHDATNFVGWDFDSIWHNDPAINYGHPYLFAFNTEKPEMAVNLLYNSGFGFILKANMLPGSTTITEYGIVGGVQAEPTLDAGNSDFSSSYTDADVTEFQSRFIGLEQSTEYFVRTYAIVNTDTVYSNPRPVTTKASLTLCPDGLGTEAAPFLISNWQELCWIDDISTTGLYFQQTADIDFADAEPAIETWNSGAGFSPISMYGIYNGAGHSVYNLYINRPSLRNIGLFSWMYKDAVVTDLGVIDADFSGSYSVGGIAGYNNGSVERCFTTGVFTADYSAGGLVGYNTGSIKNSFSKVNLIGTDELASQMGNLVGYQYSSGAVVNSYASGTVRNSEGFIFNDRGVFDSVYPTQSADIYGNYWDTEISGMDAGGGFDTYATGLTTAQMQQQANFQNWDFTTVWNVDSDINGGTPYLYPFVSNSILIESYVHAIAGNEITLSVSITAGTKPVAEYGIVCDSIIENATVGNADVIRLSLSGVEVYASDDGGVKMTDLVAGTKYYYRAYAITATDTIYNHVDSLTTIDVICAVPDGDGTEASPYLISNWQELRWLSECEDCQDKQFRQTADIDLADAEPSIKTWNYQKGWSVFSFSGVYDGGGHIIENLYADYSGYYSSSEYGFFALLTETAYVHDLGLVGVEYVGNIKTGAFVGLNAGFVERCYVVDGAVGISYFDDYAGGFVAYNSGVISQCYFNGSVQGGEYVGGFVASNSGRIEECFANGSVIGVKTVGGFVGIHGGHISNSYSMANVCKTRYSDSEKNQSNFVGQIYNGTVFNCYATGSVFDPHCFGCNNGGFVGSVTISDEDTVANNYWDVQTSGQVSNNGAEGEYASGMTTAQMKTQSAYTGWDFSTVWHIDPEYNYGYPYLQPITFDVPSVSVFSAVPAGTSVKVGGSLLVGNSPVVEWGFIAKAGDSIDFASNNYDVRTVVEQTGSEQSIETLIESLSFETEYSIMAYAFTEIDTVYSVALEAKTHKVPSAVPDGSGTEADPYLISTCGELVWLSQTPYVWDKYFEQTADLDFSTVTPAITTWDDGKGFTPIGNSTINFTGTYIGDGNKIAGLYINRNSYVGLFGALGDSAKVSNLGIVEADITATEYAGVFCGLNRGSISQCFTMGHLSGGHYTGGFTGYNSGGTIKHCFARGAVEIILDSDYTFGGFAAYNNDGSITRCYSTCKVSYQSGRAVTNRGFLYYNSGTYTDANNYWDVTTSGQTTSGGRATARSTMWMLMQEKYIGWDFTGETENGTDDIWDMSLAFNDGYPYLTTMQQGGSVAGVRVDELTANDVIFDGDVYIIDGDAVSEYGVLLSKTNTEPSLDSYLRIKNYAGATSSRSFEIFISGLTKGTQYFYRAYALVGGEVQYGTASSFITDTIPNKWPSGSGTEASPFLISSIDELTWISKHPDYWDAHYMQTADIDFAGAEPKLSTWNSNEGWSPIGNITRYFSGTYDGNGKIIANLYCSSSVNNYAGLFGRLSGTVERLGITSAYVKGKEYVGILAGTNSGAVNYCYVTGTAYGAKHTGSFVGYSSGEISNCYSRATVYPSNLSYCGGFIGYSYQGTLTNCYYAGNFRYGDDYSGFCGYRYSDSQVNCFWDKNVSYENSNSGSAVGLTTAEMKKAINYTSASWDFVGETENGTDEIWAISPSYNSGYPYLFGFNPDLPEVYVEYRMVDGSSVIIDGTAILPEVGADEVGLIVGKDDSLSFSSALTHTEVPALDPNLAFTIQVEHLDAETTYYVRGYAIKENDTVYCSETSFKTQTAFSEMPDGNGTEAVPYLITNWKELYWISQNKFHWNKHYLQTADIDLQDAVPSIENWSNGTGWASIGDYTPFIGSYAGGGHVIANLYINHSDKGYAGLFSRIGEKGSVSDLGIINAHISASSTAGILAGECKGSILRCFTSGTVQGNYDIGGIVGYLYRYKNSERMSDCYSRAEVVCLENNRYDASSAGAFIGKVWGGDISRCYATGRVIYKTMDDPVNAGFLGRFYSSYGYLFSDNYWDTESSFQTERSTELVNGEIDGLTTAQMKQSANYSDWDFSTVWNIDPAVNNGYPYLRSDAGVSDYLRLPELSNVEYTSDRQSATLSASITALNASQISSYGFVINTTTELGVETGAHLQKVDLGATASVTDFSDVFSSLDPNAIYYVRAFATNQYGTVYSAVQEVITKPLPPIQPSGSGDSESDPYLIENLQHLSWIQDQVNNSNRSFANKYFRQVNDIDASVTALWSGRTGWESVGHTTAFQANYNGDEHTISGLFIDNVSLSIIHLADTLPAGLFGNVGADGVIRNLNVSEVSINNNLRAAALAANNYGTINNCRTTGHVGSSEALGGLVAVNNGTISRSVSECSIEARGYRSSFDSSDVGGFVGVNGGVIFQSMSAMGYALSSQRNSAGFVGYNNGNIDQSNSTGFSFTNPEVSTGAFVLINEGSISNSYCFVNDTTNLFVHNNTGSIIHCYANSSLSTIDWRVTGFGTGGTLSGNFWNTDNFEGPSTTGCTGLSSSEMKRAYHYIGADWDFVGETANGTDDIWLIHPNYNYGYPFLAWEAPNLTYIGGKVYYDRDKSGSETAGDVPIGGMTVELQPLGTITGTAPDGSYIFYAEPGDYVISIQPESPYTKGADALRLPIEIGFTGKIDLSPVGLYGTDVQNYDVSLASVWSRCGRTVPVWAIVQNTGNMAGTITASIKIDSLVTFIESDTPIASTDKDGTMNFTLDGMQPYESRKVKLQVTVPPGRMDTLLYTASVSLANEIKAVDTIRNLIRCSYDPNDVQVFPTGIQPDGNVPMGQELTYMIRFQNTGNDTAFMVEVIDTLATILNPASFEMIGASHDVEYFVNPDGSMRFLFEDINLLDSTSNEPESHGFILFKVKPNANIIDGDVAALKADIFFDYNPPVITNTVITTFTEDDGMVTQLFDLHKGWNLISFYIQPQDSAVSSVFSTCIQNIDEVKTEQEFYRTQYPSYLNSLEYIDGGGAYFVRTNSVCQCTTKGLPVFAPYNQQLQPGWNLVGVPVMSAPDFSEILQGTDTKKLINYEMLWIPNETNPVIKFDPGKGYYIYSGTEGSYQWSK